MGAATSPNTVADFASRLVLGTVQLGMDYGVSNLSGKPSRAAAFEVLEHAWGCGVRSFDTAPVYGSEDLLGEFFASHGVAAEAQILTKIPRLTTTERWEDTIKGSLERSLARLKCDNVKVLFFHHASDARVLRGCEAEMMSWLEHAPIGMLGVSAYEPGDVAGFDELGHALAIQFPYNAVNRHFENTRWGSGPRFARSVFLQGLLASPGELRTSASEALSDFHARYHGILRRFEIEPKAFAFSVALKAPCVDQLLFGVDSKAQLEELMNCSVISSERIASVPIHEAVTDRAILDPRSW